MISVNEALDKLFALAQPLEAENVPLSGACDRILIGEAKSRRDQPPFASSAMDGYAVIGDEAMPGASFKVIGEAAAGHGFEGSVGPGEAVRIYTGAPVPDGATRIIIQEDVQRDGARITLADSLDQGLHIRAQGLDFKAGDVFAGPKRLTPNDIALLAAMNVSELPCARRPKVAILSTGDELVMPGEEPGRDQIIVSNSFGLQAMLQQMGCETRLLPIARDTAGSLKTAFALADDADLLLTIGGASVGDHDLVGDVAAELGMERAFYKIAMRPGKPLMAGRLRTGTMMIGLPGNPVSAMVCGTIFVAPVIRAMLGLGTASAPRHRARLAAPVGANGPREHYMRARVEDGQITPATLQDSALLSVLSTANALLVRPASAPAAGIGADVEYVAI